MLTKQTSNNKSSGYRFHGYVIDHQEFQRICKKNNGDVLKTEERQ